MNSVTIENIKLESGKTADFSLSYRVFGQKLGDAPIVLVNHALTGNSEVAGEKGWWKSLIGNGKAIDTQRFTVLAFDIPGNGQNGDFIDNYKDFTVRDIAKIFLKGLEKLHIQKLHTLIGGSLGGGIAWEMAFQKPDLAEFLIPIVTEFQTSDWLIGQCHIQENILQHSANPIHDARMHAMLVYRTPASMNSRFQHRKKDDLYEIQDWLNYHGTALQNRFSIKTYFLMNHLLQTINVCERAEELSKIQSKIHLISVDSDLCFTHDRAIETVEKIKKTKQNVHLHTIHSIHGHDAFLMEYEQLNTIINAIYK